MKKNVLLNKLNAGKRSLLIFLLTICTCYAAFAQNRQITGKVSSTDGNAVPGATVKVKGTTTAVTTDVNGAFKLSVPDNATLVVSFIGYETQEIKLGSGSVYNAVLAPSTSTLNEVTVVSVGYGTSKRTDLTGAISSVSGATVAKVPVTSLDQALQGRA